MFFKVNNLKISARMLKEREGEREREREREKERERYYIRKQT